MNDITGSWSLVEYRIERDDGTIGSTQWDNPCGLLIYTDDGQMSVTMMNQVERPFDAARWWDGGDEQKLAAANTFFAYAGRYERLADRIIHRIDVSLFPGWVGHDYDRMTEVTEDRLILRDRIPGQEASVALTWRRIA